MIQRLLSHSKGSIKITSMRTATISLIVLTFVAGLFGASDGFKKARVFRANIGFAIPPPPDSDKDEGKKDEHEAANKEAAARTLYVFLRDDKGTRIVAVPCEDRCRQIQTKLLANPEVETKTEGKKVLIRSGDETLTGTRYRMKEKD